MALEAKEFLLLAMVASAGVFLFFAVRFVLEVLMARALIRLAGEMRRLQERYAEFDASRRYVPEEPR